MTPTDTNTEHFVATPHGEAAGTLRNASDFDDSATSANPDDSIDLLDLALVLAARKRFILLFSLIVAIITAIVVLVVPQTFTATATMMPPQKESSASALLGQLGGLAALAGGGGGAASMLGLKNPDDLYIGLLQSETIGDAIIDRYHLMHVYSKKRLSDARKSLKSHTTIVAEKSSLISIAVKDHDPKRAAGMANAYIDQLHDLMSHLAVTEAGQRRLFFQQQLELEKNQLADAEVALETTERKTGIIQPQGQATAVIGTIMQLQAQISARQVELGALRTSATNQNPEVVTLQSQIAGLQAQLADFEKGHPGAVAAAGNVLTPTSQVPAASLEYIRRMRDVRYHETLFELMARQYEMARVDEAKQGQAIQVVDPALIPDKRSWPPRTLLVVLAFILSMMISSFWAILQSSYQHRMQDPELAAKAGKLRQMISPRQHGRIINR
jgi:tyrosine-protein kinase Etk/Wzc